MDVKILLKFPTDVSKVSFFFKWVNGLRAPSRPVQFSFISSPHSMLQRPAIITSALWHATSTAAAIADVDFRFTTQLPPLANSQRTDPHMSWICCPARGFDSNWSFVLINTDFYVQSQVASWIVVLANFTRECLSHCFRKLFRITYQMTIKML